MCPNSQLQWCKIIKLTHAPDIEGPGAMQWCLIPTTIKEHGLTFHMPDRGFLPSQEVNV